MGFKDFKQYAANAELAQQEAEKNAAKVLVETVVNKCRETALDGKRELRLIIPFNKIETYQMVARLLLDLDDPPDSAAVDRGVPPPQSKGLVDTVVPIFAVSQPAMLIVRW